MTSQLGMMPNPRIKVLKSQAWSRTNAVWLTNDPPDCSSSSKIRYPYNKWDKVSLQKAACTVTEGVMSLRKASVLYGVPKSTLHD